MAPHIALEETGAAYNAVEIDEVGGEHLTEVYRRIIGMLERALTIWTCLSAPGGGVTVNVCFRPKADTGETLTPIVAQRPSSPAALPKRRIRGGKDVGWNAWLGGFTNVLPAPYQTGRQGR